MTVKRIKLDRINQRIMIELQRNARISNIELAESVALSPSACLQRVKALEETGMIKGYLMNPDIEMICHSVKAYGLVTLKSNDYEHGSRFEKCVKGIPEVIDCLKTSGSIDYIALIMCSRIEDVNRLCDQILAQDLNIERLETCFVMSAPKWFGGYPLENLEWKVD
tara:strand:+ start:13920 stop:14417 length:498 start_codon:yes stop_codon:yes gene_type:complete